VLRMPLNSSTETRKQGDYEQDQEQVEQNFRHAGGGYGDSAETEYRGDQCDDKERQCPVQHFSISSNSSGSKFFATAKPH
jgi:hypothetical protein